MDFGAKKTRIVDTFKSAVARNLESGEASFHCSVCGTLVIHTLGAVPQRWTDRTIILRHFAAAEPDRCVKIASESDASELMDTAVSQLAGSWD